jgi:signal transduction histidine kinase
VRIRRRLVLYAVAVATLGMTLFGVLLYGLAARGVETDLDEALARLAAETASVVESMGPDALAGREPLAPVDPSTSVEPFVEVLDETGAVIYSTATLAGAPPRIPAAVVVEATETGTSVATVRPADGVELRVAADAWTSADRTGVAVAGRSAAFIDDQLGGLGSFLLLSGIITIIAVAIVSWLVIGRALRPLRTLAATADEIAATGDLDRRLPPVRTRDEVGTLTASFNGMLDRLSASQASLADALSAQRRFVADASHELRTPLTTIRSNAEFLAGRPDAQPTDRDAALGDIVVESERMSRMVDGLLVLARVDAGGVFERQPVDLAAVASDVARRASSAGAARAGGSGPAGRPLRATGSGPAVVDGDLDALTRLCWILVDNAILHGGGEIEVAVSGTGGRVVLSVADRGPGLPEGDPDRLFDRFHRADRARAGDGAGLGLAIARSIAEAHGGSIRAADRPDGGAVFTVDLPAGSP